MDRAGVLKMGVGWRASLVLAVLLPFVTGYEEIFSISQLSPKSAANERLHPDILLQTSHVGNIEFSIEPSVRYDDIEPKPEDLISDEETENHVIVERSVEPFRGSRSINIDEIPLSNNNEIDNELELHNKRKYYEIVPTKTYDYLSNDEAMLMSTGFGDKLDFKFPGEEKRAPKGRALAPAGPKIRPTAVHPPTFATANLRDGRQNTEIQNIITGIVKLLNGNVNVQANTQLLNGRPRPMASRINNRGPPRITEVPSLSDYEKPITPPPMPFHPTKIPPPYPFDRPHGVNLPEQIVPSMNNRPGFHRPIPPWQRPRPRPNPNRRPNPGLPVYKPTLIPPPDIPDEEKDEVVVNENETHSENNIHHDEGIPLNSLPETTTEVKNVTEATEKDAPVTTETSSTTTTEATTPKTTTTNKPEVTTEVTTEKPTTQKTTTEKSKTDKPLKPEKDKKKDNGSEKDKSRDKYKIDIIDNMKNDTPIIEIEPSIVDISPSTVFTSAPTPTEGLVSHRPVIETSAAKDIETSSINIQPLQTSQTLPHQPYRPRPGIVLDDTDFKPHGTRYRPDAPIITAAETRLPGYGEIFDVTVSAIQGPGEKGASVHIENVNIHNEHDIIVSASGDHGFVSIDGKRTYLNLFDTSTSVQIPSITPTRVQNTPLHTAPPSIAAIGTGVAIPADDVTVPPRRPQARPHQPYRRPQPTVRIDTCIVGDDSTCDQAQNEMCKTEAGISSCQCRPGYARAAHRDPCRKVVSLLLNLKIDKIYDRKLAWDSKFLDKESEPYQQLSFEAVRAIDSAFSMTQFSDDFVAGSVNSIHNGDEENRGVYVNYTLLLQDTAELSRAAAAGALQRALAGVLRRRGGVLGAGALHAAPAAVPPPTDLDECSSRELNDCHALATCTNNWGSFKCTCAEGTLDAAAHAAHAGRRCAACAASHCADRGTCRYAQGRPYCVCASGYYGSTCEVDGEVVGAAVGACLVAALVIALTLAALLSWSRKWSREQKAVGMGSPVFNYMASNTIKTPPVGQPPYQVTLEERMRWAQIAEAMAQANHYASPEHTQTMATRPSSAMFGGYPPLPPVPLPRLGMHGAHTGTLNTVTSRANTSVPHHMYGYTNHASDTTSSEASSLAQDRADLLVPRPKSRARSMHNQTGIYYDVDYENAPEPIYGTKGIPLSTYTVSRGPPFYR